MLFWILLSALSATAFSDCSPDGIGSCLSEFSFITSSSINLSDQKLENACKIKDDTIDCFQSIMEPCRSSISKDVLVYLNETERFIKDEVCRNTSGYRHSVKQYERCFRNIHESLERCYNRSHIPIATLSLESKWTAECSDYKILKDCVFWNVMSECGVAALPILSHVVYINGAALEVACRDVPIPLRSSASKTRSFVPVSSSTTQSPITNTAATGNATSPIENSTSSETTQMPTTIPSSKAPESAVSSKCAHIDVTECLTEFLGFIGPHGIALTYEVVIESCMMTYYSVYCLQYFADECESSIKVEVKQALQQTKKFVSTICRKESNFKKGVKLYEECLQDASESFRKCYNQLLTINTISVARSKDIAKCREYTILKNCALQSAQRFCGHTAPQLILDVISNINGAILELKCRELPFKLQPSDWAIFLLKYQKISTASSIIDLSSTEKPKISFTYSSQNITSSTYVPQTSEAILKSTIVYLPQSASSTFVSSMVLQVIFIVALMFL